ncbi:MAG: preprotein translocase subunit SecE [Phycisphaerales bacterium]|jgi:preprotein translocase subunit SecE|nr:preprotein translocase subunit SecE [Phycisphaerae bacterium]MBT5409911.1 preprotein translocase subunit SecE [Phycisphaerae bacterium]MBT6164603.1 preprotein translocase subunit SecE [Phycisphaerae bacterium]MBT7657214.1 preprotein translocase subunit SecE [Phycisphaerae bacterium]MDE1038245.1 preprotein translocase subunit SecE [Phycisphaerales bacterium]|tara:strand:+ start:5680 stop:6090 length:411 start_codon:yes stop_codon:yes gene_type:complete
MSASIYKSGQGYWVRMMSAIGFFLLVLMGIVWLSEQLAVIKFGEIETVYVQGAAAIIVGVTFALIGFWLIGRKQKFVDFMIATEGEMRKVNWSTKREIIGSTILVILLTFFIAIFCQIADLLFSWFFQSIDVLQSV